MQKFLKLIFTLLIAFAITLIPMPTFFYWCMPQVCLLVLLAWSYLQPHYINVGTAWIVGLLLDVFTGSLLGLHAFSLVLILYLFLLFHARISMFHRIQQSLIVGCFALLNSVVVFCLQSMFGESEVSMGAMLSVFLTALFWPAVLSIITYLTKPHRRTGWSD